MVQNTIIIAFLFLLTSCAKKFTYTEVDYSWEPDTSAFGLNFHGHTRQYWDSVDKPIWDSLDRVWALTGELGSPSEYATMGYTKGDTTEVIIKHPSIAVMQRYFIINKRK